ncbi:MAG: DUF4271 domain-containing protein [Bacteroidales bacterium]|jgi:hypothetical protein|nr:DUF4271 domain-containing protein [Bacteroidales bacterium]NLK79143.1 DUF4271 domain-containing protein [Bacteroidales bacterium]HKM30927.1 DUF4271 domain-containing protein [Bacteroidales bacterium]HPX79109.1 DUF4271 domain-containing protein [Bacteroidales bacterium]
MDWIVLGLAVSLCLIFLFTRDALALLFLGCFRYNISMENEEQGSIRFSRAFLCLFTLTVLAYFITTHDRLFSPLPYALTGLSEPALFFIILGALCTWTLLRYVLIKCIGWVIDRPAFTDFLERTGRDFCILSGFVFIPFLLVFYLMGKADGNAVLIAAIVVFSAGYVFYVLRSLKIFLSAGFSLFFWILYLCILEVIPIGVLIHFLAGIRL